MHSVPTHNNNTNKINDNDGKKSNQCNQPIGIVLSFQFRVKSLLTNRSKTTLNECNCNRNRTPLCFCFGFCQWFVINFKWISMWRKENEHSHVGVGLCLCRWPIHKCNANFSLNVQLIFGRKIQILSANYFCFLLNLTRLAETLLSRNGQNQINEPFQ